MDVRYLNYSHAPVPSPLKKPLCIELYNDVYFPSSKSIIDTTTNQPSTSLDSLAFQPHPFPATTTNSSKFQLPPVPPSLPITRPSVPLDNTLHSSIVKSADKLFFVQYTPERTLRPRWYLVSVDIESTLEVCSSFASDSTYWCVFQARHPNDSQCSDEYARWWPEWHKYHTDTTTGVMVYDERILFPPHRNPNKDKYVEWATALTLAGTESCSIVGPFNFQPCNEFNRMRRKVSRFHWDQLKTTCDEFGILPPTLGPSLSHIPSRPRKTKKRKHG